MSHVFLSYSSKHRDLTEALADYLKGAGLEVWWDHELAARGPFDWQIHEKLRTAACVIVLWTEGALTSEWVKREADYARERNMIINVTAEGVAHELLPAPYNIHDQHRPSEREAILRDVLAVREGRLLLEDKREALPGTGERTPTMLLQAKYGVVPFVGGQGVFFDLLDWATAEGQYAQRRRRAAGRLIHGPGGLGKTRLLIEVADTLRQRGWSAGFLSRPDTEQDTVKKERRLKALEHLIRGATDKGLLLIMDYAEGRNEEIARLARAIQTRPLGDHRPICFVLLARGDGDWWARLVDENPEAQVLFGNVRGGGADVVPLRGLATAEDRLSLFHKARAAFAAKLFEDGYPTPDGDPDQVRLRRIETGEGYDRPIAIVMEALLYLAAMAPSGNEPAVHRLLANVLGLERAHWKKLVGPLKSNGQRDPDFDLRRAVAQIAGLQGARSRREAEDLFMADAHYKGERTSRSAVREVADNILRIYGRSDAIAHLEPDLIGEHHFGLTADKDLLDGCIAWTQSAPEGEREALRRNLLTVLQRASRPEHGATGVERARALLDHLIIQHGGAMGATIVDVMLDTPGELFSRLSAQVDDLSEMALAEINFALPVKHFSWMEFSLRIAERYVQLARNRISADAEEMNGPQRAEVHDRAATALLRLGSRLSNLGRHEEALAASQEALDIRRALVKDRPDGFLNGLATSLICLGTDLSLLGRDEAALAATQEALDIRRALAKERPDACLPDLALNLSNTGAILSNLGRREAALAASQEALDIYRVLAKERPDAFLDDLATNLDFHGGNLFYLGRREAALAASQEALDIRRVLAKDRPDAFLEDLATSLNSTGVMLSNLGRREEALAASQEALDIRRALAKDQPDAFLPDLALSLSNLGGDLSRLGRHEAGLAASREAVDIFQALAKDRPDAIVPQLATSLDGLGSRLSNLGRHEEALAASQDAVDIFQALAKDRPDAFLPDLATSLAGLGIRLSTLGRREAALGASQEALDIRRALARDRPDAFLDDLAGSLICLGADLSNLGRYEAALAASQEALDIRRALVKERPDACLPDLALNLSNTGAILCEPACNFDPSDGVIGAQF